MKMEELLQWFQNNGGNMFIEYNENDLLELFLNEPVGIGELNEELIYSYKNDMGFSITMYLNVYAQKIELSLSYNDTVLFNDTIHEVESIIRINNDLLINSKSEKKLKLKFYPQVGVEFIEH